MMKRCLILLTVMAAALIVRAEPAPAWELGVDPIPAQLAHGIDQAVSATVDIGPDKWFALPADMLVDQHNYRVEFEFALPAANPGRITLMSNLDKAAMAGLELRYSPPTYNAAILCVNGFSLFDRREMAQAAGFTSVCIEVRNGRASVFRGDQLIGTSGPLVKPSQHPLRFGGTYMDEPQDTGSYRLRKLRIYNQLEKRPAPESTAVELKGHLDLYVCIGQSNMAGRAPFAGEEAGIIERCYLLNHDDLWEPAQNPLNLYSSIRKQASMQKMGPAYMFARTMLEQENAAPIGLIVNAQGGSSIRAWAEGGYFYREILRRTRIAQQHGTLRGILWHQGETDRADAQYLEKLTALIAALRKDLGEPNLPFVAGQVNDVQLINDQLDQLPATVTHTGVASSAGLTAMDRWHFDTESMHLLGRRYAEQMLKLQQRSSSQTEPERKNP